MVIGRPYVSAASAVVIWAADLTEVEWRIQ
jgi:hypothetical protein